MLPAIFLSIPERFVCSHPLELQLDANLDDLVGWDVKKCRRVHGIAGQKEK